MPQNVFDRGGGKILSRMKLAVCLVMVARDVDSIQTLKYLLPVPKQNLLPYPADHNTQPKKAVIFLIK